MTKLLQQIDAKITQADVDYEAELALAHNEALVNRHSTRAATLREVRDMIAEAQDGK